MVYKLPERKKYIKKERGFILGWINTREYRKDLLRLSSCQPCTHTRICVGVVSDDTKRLWCFVSTGCQLLDEWKLATLSNDGMRAEDSHLFSITSDVSCCGVIVVRADNKSNNAVCPNQLVGLHVLGSWKSIQNPYYSWVFRAVRICLRVPIINTKNNNI